MHVNVKITYVCLYCGIGQHTTSPMSTAQAVQKIIFCKFDSLKMH